jgi:hypothetical protein
VWRDRPFELTMRIWPFVLGVDGDGIMIPASRKKLPLHEPLRKRPGVLQILLVGMTLVCPGEP